VLPPQLPRVVDSFKAPLLYREPLREVILAFKFEDKTPYALPLARLLAASLPDDVEAILVPVPLHARRLRARFYNQSALLAQELARLTGRLAVVDGLRREGDELQQASKTRAGRLRLRAKDFTARAEAVAGKTVILVDDIYTTGATARACALALKRAGATAVHVRTVAYTPAGG
jgi:ComF family protein